MYEIVLVLHSLMRWVVILTALLAVGRGIAGWTGRRSWTPTDDATGRWFVMAMTVQFVLGLFLWGYLSPYGVAGFSDAAATMRDGTRRFWAVEHFVMMVISVAVAHAGSARVRKASGDQRRHRAAAIFYGLSLVLALIAIPWAGVNVRPLVRWF
jgi:hypothetical protein